VVIESVGQRPAHSPIEFTQDRAAMLDGFAPGEQVTVTAFVNGREWTGRDGVLKHFLSLSGNRIERVGAPATASATATAGVANGYPAPGAADMPPASEDDDLPF
jgi:single-stranded DNA-binding protein